ncbi:MAG TPA: tRNA (adenosine(37)-N6)-threonylcarbamoyltransferase complex ATPase subunit type 1 TsaE [Pyrinomonadaceae bacterium]|nr:tRNA (adenosine(37)-N6)-threonylcarbamoyltransferase complex ATPase subunit type 1 TsaE [Chloracidobacterium sp.]MBP9936263.1 tRNA (adenosine(37)-N6)-threonylcarbamoyltransferase complex ATPase subunit type 1 TsaE [Pyrinomonadaceae bacterium]MBK7802225.1 tRNA (adenosine(37)-N6)-threonylcarbamoyltransferase complex ATPase subunit type 1 TsaE [Chloracidobacterium sp.]MBK9767791.1 tRNA (adenosine(37)-N6)-threonylcarbamoyltransferase complex ATPase subunit type 1 TsaE [Chloracidobacterium sp.]MB
MSTTKTICPTPEMSFELGQELGRGLRSGDVVLLEGGLGAGKTLFTKGIVNALGYDVDEVTSPSFAIVNLYELPEIDVYHVDLWRLDPGLDIYTAIGLDEILDSDRALTIIEWPERLAQSPVGSGVINVKIEGDGDEPRTITIDR